MSVEPGAPARTQDLLVPRSKPTSTTLDLPVAGEAARDVFPRLIGCGGLESKGVGVATDVFSGNAVGIMAFLLVGRTSLKRTEKSGGPAGISRVLWSAILSEHLVDEVRDPWQHRGGAARGGLSQIGRGVHGAIGFRGGVGWGEAIRRKIPLERGRAVCGCEQRQQDFCKSVRGVDAILFSGEKRLKLHVR